MIKNIKFTQDSEVVLGEILHNKNLLENKLPEVFDQEGNFPTIKGAMGRVMPEAVSLLTDGRNVFNHIDILGHDRYLVYDLGEELSIDAFCMLGNVYTMCFPILEFELYGSDNREDLFKGENMIVHFFNELTVYNFNSRRKDKNTGGDIMIDMEGAKMRFFGIRFVRANYKDDIIRVANITLINREFTAKYRESNEKSEFNLCVNTDEIVNDNYYGFGGNIIPSSLMPESLQTGATKELFELEKAYLKKIHLTVTRVWFQIDWITDNYEDYKNGIYTFNSEKFNAFCEYMNVLKDSGTEILLNFGWKTDNNIADWFIIETANVKRNGAPRELDLFAKACAATIRELVINRNLDNLKYLTFYNEPRPDRDFSTAKENTPENWEFSIKYWRKMCDLTVEELEKDGTRHLVDMWGPEQAREQGLQDDLFYLEGVEKIPNSPLKVLTTHIYEPFEYFFEKWIPAHRKISGGKPICITEYNCRNRMHWYHNTVQAFIHLANFGYAGLLQWSISCVRIPSPLNFVIGSFAQLYNTQRCGGNFEPVGPYWKEITLLTNYVPAHSKVLKSEKDDKDVRIAAFKLPDGNMTVLVELNNSTKSDRKIEVKFDKAIDRKFYVHKYTREKSYRIEYGTDYNGIVVPAVEELEVGDTIRYNADEKYTLFCFTTLPPIKQIELDKVGIVLKAGESEKINASLIDAQGDIEWQYISGNGSISADGVITMSKEAKPYDMVAVKAVLKGTDTYAVAIARCVE